MLNNSDLEIVEHLRMENDGEPLVGVHHVVQRKRLAGKIVHTICGGRMIREKDIYHKSDGRAQKYFSQWVEINRPLIAGSLHGRLTVPEFRKQINGGYGDPEKILSNATGLFISILFYAALKTISTTCAKESLELTDNDLDQWTFLVRNTPVSLIPEGGIQSFPGIAKMLVSLTAKNSEDQDLIIARDYVASLPTIVYDRNHATRDCPGRRRAEEERAVIETQTARQLAELELKKREEEDERSLLELEEQKRKKLDEEQQEKEEKRDLITLIKACPTAVQVEFANLKRDRELLQEYKIKNEELIKQLARLQEKIFEDHREHTMELVKCHQISLTISDTNRRGIAGEMRVKELLETALRGLYPVISTRSDPDSMDLHVKLGGNKIVAIEVKLHKTTVDQNSIKRFFDNISYLAGKEDITLVGAALISLTSNIPLYNQRDIVGFIEPKSGVNVWMVNHLETALNPSNVLAGLFSELVQNEYRHIEGRATQISIQRGEPIKSRFVDHEQYFSEIRDLDPKLARCCVAHLPQIQQSNITERAVIQTAVDQDGRIVTQSHSTDEGIIIKTIIDPIARISGAEIKATNGDTGSLIRDGITGAVVASAVDGQSGSVVQHVMVGSVMRPLIDGIDLPRDIPEEYHNVFNMTVPWGPATQEVSKTIISLCHADPNSHIRQGLLIDAINEVGTGRAIRNVRQHVANIIKSSCVQSLKSDKRKTVIVGLRLKSG